MLRQRHVLIVLCARVRRQQRCNSNLRVALRIYERQSHEHAYSSMYSSSMTYGGATSCGGYAHKRVGVGAQDMLNATVLLLLCVLHPQPVQLFFVCVLLLNPPYPPPPPLCDNHTAAL